MTASWRIIGTNDIDSMIGRITEFSTLVVDTSAPGDASFQYLDSRHYCGDMSPEILLAALQELRRPNLQQKYPYFVLVNDLNFEFLPDQACDIIHAHTQATSQTLGVRDDEG